MLLLVVIISLIIFALAWFYSRQFLWLLFFLSPFLGLTLDFNKYQWSRNLLYLGQVQANAVDLLALFLIVVVGLKVILELIKTKRWPFSWYRIGFWVLAPFLAIGLISLLNVGAEQLAGSFKYWLRPMVFAYVVWLAMPFLLIKEKAELEIAIKVFFWAGVIAAVWGLLTTWLSPAEFGFWRRVTPGNWLGIAPLTYNHNILAEVLVATVPLSGYLFLQLRSGRMKKVYFLSFFLITATALLTFSRAAWLGLLVQTGLWLWFKGHAPKRHGFLVKEQSWGGVNWHKVGPYLLLGIGLVAPLAIYMAVFSFSPLVASSNATRLDLTGIAVVNWLKHPWLGNGVGTFVPLVAETRVFFIEYGDPLDAHGVAQKLLAETGILGLIAFLAFLIWLLYRVYFAIYHSHNHERLLLVCLFLSCAGMITFEMFNTSYYNAHLWVPLGLALTAVEVMRKKSG